MKIKSSYPISVYVLFILIVLVIILTFPANLIEVLFYIVFCSVLFYITFSRYACKIEIVGMIMSVKYFFPWEKRHIKIDLSQMESFDYGRSFYDFSADKALGGIFGFPKYYYDQITFKTKDGNYIYVEVNTMIFKFSKIKKYINNCLVLK